MPLIRRSPLAKIDYADIWNYIADDNMDAADALLQRIDSKLNIFAAFPLAGTRRESLAPGLRSFPEGNYLVFYRIIDGGIEVVRVIQGNRDLKLIFKPAG